MCAGNLQLHSRISESYSSRSYIKVLASTSLLPPFTSHLSPQIDYAASFKELRPLLPCAPPAFLRLSPCAPALASLRLRHCVAILRMKIHQRTRFLLYIIITFIYASPSSLQHLMIIFAEQWSFVLCDTSTIIWMNYCMCEVIS